MAYFSNSSDGSLFDEQCGRCKFGDAPCPVALAQSLYNYEACNNPTARKILDLLVKDDGTCEVFKMMEREITADPDQIEAFPYPPSLKEIQNRRNVT